MLIAAVLLTLEVSGLLADTGGGEPTVSLERTEIDFGQVQKGTVVEESFPIENTGGTTLRIERVELTSGGMKIAVQQVIEPGRTENAKISWDTSAFAGDAMGQALLYLNDPNRPRLVLTLKGRVLAPVEILPQPAFYLSQFVGEAVRGSLLLQNNQQRKLEILGLERRGGHFEAAYEVVEPGKMYRLLVYGLADTAPGRYREAMTVLTDDPWNQKINVEVNLLVKGNVFVSVDELDFGRVSLRTLRSNPTATQFLTQTFVINRRSGKMKIIRAESDLAFLRVRVDPQTRADAFTVSVEPIANQLKPGEYTGSLRMRTDDPEYPELQLPIAIRVTD